MNHEMKRITTVGLWFLVAILLQLVSSDMVARGQFAATQKASQSEVTNEKWKEYEGRYEVNPHQLYNFVVDIVVEGDSLSARLSHRQKRTFLFKATDEFLDQETRRIILTFVRDQEHKVVALKIAKVNMTYYFDDLHNVTSRMIPGTVELAAKKIDLPAASLTGNTTFILKGFANARIVALAGSFNHWNQTETLMARENDRWICRIELSPGRYQYKFVVDGAWITDPDNDRVEDDGLGNLNSIREIR